MGYLTKALMLKRESLEKDSKEKVDDLLQMLQSELRKPLLIESARLGQRLYLVANECQAREIEQAGGICYLPGEIGTLLDRSNGMDGEVLKDYLNKLHAAKRAFPGARIKET